jgi:uncharacterized protein with HEPN domain
MSEATPNREWRFYLEIHGYLGIDNDTLWSIVETDIPLLLTSLRDLKSKVSK